MPDNDERELKLVPDDPALLDQLADLSQLSAFVVTGRRRERQRNSFFDSASRALAHARVGFRRRIVAGERLATWSLKVDGQAVRGVQTRTEIELQLAPEMPPALAIGALRQAAHGRGAQPLAEGVTDALATGGLPIATPFLETETDRRIIDLAQADRGWSVELALDRVELVGHTYSEVEIEAELKRGDDATLDDIRTAIESVGGVHESSGSKLSRALDHLAECNCPGRAAAISHTAFRPKS